MTNGFSFGFGSLTGSSHPRVVDHRTNPDSPPPLLGPHYQASSLLRGGPPLSPASLLSPSWFPPLGGLALASRVTTSSHERPDRYRGPGSHVPHQSLNQARATSTPDTTWSTSRSPPGSSRDNDSPRF